MNQSKKQTYLKEIGIRIRQIRESLGYTRETLSAKIGLSIDMIKKLENGCNDPKSSSVMKISEALGVTTDYILYGYDSESKIDVLVVPNISKLDEKGLLCLKK